jgi:hypothetical protein
MQRGQRLAERQDEQELGGLRLLSRYPRGIVDMVLVFLCYVKNGVKLIKTSLSKKGKKNYHQLFKQIYTGCAGRKLTDGGVRKNKPSVYITLCQQNPRPFVLLCM